MSASREELYRSACQRFEMLTPLSEACRVCRMCALGWSKARKGSYEYDPHVFSNHDPALGPSDFMVVGQNPGWNEVRLGQPFVGQAGANFDQELLQTMWRRHHFYITNAVKCYTPGNRPPDHENLRRCEPFLRMEIAIVKPTLVLALGAVAFGILCEDMVFAERIGKISNSSKFGIKVFATYHPSPLNLSDLSRRDRFKKDIFTIARVMNYYLSPF